MSTELKLLDDEQEIDWETYKKTSLFPGGFGEERQRIWPKLLGVPDTVIDDDEGISQDAHDDERQIRLDTDRSFVLYPVDDEKRDREELQQELNQLRVSFRKRPKLSYFQGYHDIITVIFLTLPSELQLACAEKLSLHRIRDSMGVGLEPVLGLVRVMQNLLRVADPDYSQLLERVSPLPFYALSNILTLFSHDMPTLHLIQHVFDYLLCRPPVIIVYLAAAIIIARKDEVRKLDEEDEDGMIHSLLNSLPNITDDIVEDPPSERELSAPLEESLQEEIKPEPEAVSLASSVKPETSGEDRVEEEKEVDDDELNLLSLREHDESPLEEPLSHEKTSPSKRKLTISLSSLLLHADFLYETYPPTHPSLALSGIMGPNSVVHTWAASISGTLSDDEAEDMVRHPEHIVFPPRPEIAEKEEDAIQVEKARRKRRKLVKKRRTIMMAAVVVLGIAMAMYGTRNGTIRSGERLRTTGGGRQFRKMEGWMRNFVLGRAAWVLDMGGR